MIFIIKRLLDMSEIHLIILIAAVAVISYPALKTGAEEVVLDLARILAWVITCAKRFLGW